jgi:hypothetical protein
MALPPVKLGATKLTVALPLPRVTAVSVGASGIVYGVTLTLPDASLSPEEFTAFTLQLYCTPLVSPVTLIGLAVPVAVIDPAAAAQVATYSVIADPPVSVGAVNVMVALALPAVAVPMVGAPGTVISGSVVESSGHATTVTRSTAASGAKARRMRAGVGGRHRLLRRSTPLALDR